MPPLCPYTPSVSSRDQKKICRKEDSRRLSHKLLKLAHGFDVCPDGRRAMLMRFRNGTKTIGRFTSPTYNTQACNLITGSFPPKWNDCISREILPLIVLCKVNVYQTVTPSHFLLKIVAFLVSLLIHRTL